MKKTSGVNTDMIKRILLLAPLLAVTAVRPLSAAEPPPFGQWLDGFRQEARAAGITETFLD